MNKQQGYIDSYLDGLESQSEAPMDDESILDGTGLDETELDDTDYIIHKIKIYCIYIYMPAARMKKTVLV